MNEGEVLARLDAVAAAEVRLHDTVATFDDGDLTAPSLCPGWTRGHVLAHVALNAHSLVNLIEWARTGRETPQYPSWAARDADIERSSSRTIAEHRAALAEGAEAFRDAARTLPVERWDFEVSGIGGSSQPVARFLFGRLREVEVHHVDLDAGYRPADWDDEFVARVLEDVPERLGRDVDEPFVAHATDLAERVRVGAGDGALEVEGPGHALLAWLLGRSEGAGLTTNGGALPKVPAWG